MIWTIIKLIWNHPSNAGRRLSTVARSIAWQFYKRTVRKPFSIPAFGGQFRCYHDSQESSRMIYFNTMIDPQEMAFLRKYLRPGDNVIDAGANVGIYTLYCASLIGPTGRIVAFEPDPSAVARLRENIEINGLDKMVEVREAAISNIVGTADFTQGADTGNALYSVRTYDRPPQQVAVTTLDKEIGGRTVELCKMDVEGAEWNAFKGTEAALWQGNPIVWLVELSEKMAAKTGGSIAAIQEWLLKRGYRVWRYDPEANELYPFISAPRRPGHVGDGIVIADARLDWVKNRLAEAPAG